MVYFNLYIDISGIEYIYSSSLIIYGSQQSTKDWAKSFVDEYHLFIRKLEFKSSSPIIITKLSIKLSENTLVTYIFELDNYCWTHQL